MSEYYVEVQVPGVKRDVSGNEGAWRWAGVGPGTRDQAEAKVSYDYLLAQGLKVRVVKYGPKIVASYLDMPQGPAALPAPPPVAKPMGSTAPMLAVRDLPATGTADAGSSPLFDQLIKVKNGRVMLPSMADLEAEAGKAAESLGITDAKTIEAAAEEVAENSAPEAPAVQEDMHPDAVYGREVVARAELKAHGMQEHQQKEVASERPEMPDDTKLDLMPGDPGFLDAFKAAQASQAAAATRLLHRHEGTVRSTRSAQANS